MTTKRNAQGAITNAEELTAELVTHEAVLCPACHEKVFSDWPEGWDAHASWKCAGCDGVTTEAKKAYFKQRFSHLFRKQ